MRLWIERSEARNWLGRRVYRLRLALEVEAVEAEIIDRHGLDTAELWVSPAAASIESEAAQAMVASAAAGGWSFTNMSKSIAAHRAALRLFREARDEPHVTVGDLLTGTTLEAGEVSDLLELEAGVRAGFVLLADKIDSLASFEDMTETVVEPEVEDGGVPAARWLSMRKR